MAKSNSKKGGDKPPKKASRKKSPPKRPRKEPPLPPLPDPETLNPADRALSEHERRFVDEYLIDLLRTPAYMRATPGVDYRTASARASDMYYRPHVKAEIETAKRIRAQRCGVKADAVLKEIGRIAFSDVYELFDPVTGNLRHPRHIPIDVRRTLAKMKVSRERRSVQDDGTSRTTVTEQVIEYTLWPKNDALGKLANYLGLNTSIPPIEALLNGLPQALAQQIRAAMVAQNGPVTPSTNGTHK